MIRVLICDDQAIARQGLQMILSTAPDINIVGMAQDGQEAVELIAATQLDMVPDVVLMDLKMPQMNGVQATRKIRGEYPTIRILVLTTYADDEWVYEAVRAGASGYLLKDTPPQQIITAIRGTADGKTHVDPDVAGKIFAKLAEHAIIPDKTVEFDLSHREIDVLRLASRGLTNSTIARELHLSEGTVGNYMSTILHKLNANDRTQAVVTAIRYGIIDLSDL